MREIVQRSPIGRFRKYRAPCCLALCERDMKNAKRLPGRRESFYSWRFSDDVADNARPTIMPEMASPGDRSRSFSTTRPVNPGMPGMFWRVPFSREKNTPHFHKFSFFFLPLLPLSRQIFDGAHVWRETGGFMGCDARCRRLCNKRKKTINSKNVLTQLGIS